MPATLLVRHAAILTTTTPGGTTMAAASLRSMRADATSMSTPVSRPAERGPARQSHPSRGPWPEDRLGGADLGRRHTSATAEFKPGRHEGCGLPYLRFRRWLDELRLTTNSLAEVVYEEVRAHRGTLAAQSYGALLGHLTAWAEANEVPYAGVPVGTIKGTSPARATPTSAPSSPLSRHSGSSRPTTTRPMPWRYSNGR
jgi:hypothetical protein